MYWTERVYTFTKLERDLGLSNTLPPGRGRKSLSKRIIYREHKYLDHERTLILEEWTYKSKVRLSRGPLSWLMACLRPPVHNQLFSFRPLRALLSWLLFYCSGSKQLILFGQWLYAVLNRTIIQALAAVFLFLFIACRVVVRKST